jgi:hypothetical protein
MGKFCKLYTSIRVRLWRSYLRDTSRYNIILCTFAWPLHFPWCYLEPVYTMDHEVGPWKMAFFHGPTFMVQFLKKSVYKVFWAPSRCKSNVDREEWPCTKKGTCWFFLIYEPHGGTPLSQINRIFLNDWFCGCKWYKIIPASNIRALYMISR